MLRRRDASIRLSGGGLVHGGRSYAVRDDCLVIRSHGGRDNSNSAVRSRARYKNPVQCVGTARRLFNELRETGPFQHVAIGQLIKVAGKNDRG